MPEPSRKSLPIANTHEARVPSNRFDLERALDGIVSAQSKRHWRTLTQELGERGIPVADLGNLNAYSKDLLELLADDNDFITLSDLVVLGQYSKAIKEGDTKAATFLRDTAGYKPAENVTVEHRQNGLEAMTDEELRQLLAVIEKENIDVASEQ